MESLVSELIDTIRPATVGHRREMRGGIPIAHAFNQ